MYNSLMKAATKSAHHVAKHSLNKSSKKAMKIGSKIATTAASAVIARKIVNDISAHDKPLEDYEDKKKREKKEYERIVRNSVVTTSVGIAGVATHVMLKDMINHM